MDAIARAIDAISRTNFPSSEFNELAYFILDPPVAVVPLLTTSRKTTKKEEEEEVITNNQSKVFEAIVRFVAALNAEDVGGNAATDPSTPRAYLLPPIAFDDSLLAEDRCAAAAKALRSDAIVSSLPAYVPPNDVEGLISLLLVYSLFFSHSCSSNSSSSSSFPSSRLQVNFVAISLQLLVMSEEGHTFHDQRDKAKPSLRRELLADVVFQADGDYSTPFEGLPTASPTASSSHKNLFFALVSTFCSQARAFSTTCISHGELKCQFSPSAPFQLLEPKTPSSTIRSAISLCLVASRSQFINILSSDASRHHWRRSDLLYAAHDLAAALILYSDHLVLCCRSGNCEPSLKKRNHEDHEECPPRGSKAFECKRVAEGLLRKVSGVVAGIARDCASFASTGKLHTTPFSSPPPITTTSSRLLSAGADKMVRGCKVFLNGLFALLPLRELRATESCGASLDALLLLSWKTLVGDIAVEYAGMLTARSELRRHEEEEREASFFLALALKLHLATLREFATLHVDALRASVAAATSESRGAAGGEGSKTTQQLRKLRNGVVMNISEKNILSLAPRVARCCASVGFLEVGIEVLQDALSLCGGRRKFPEEERVANVWLAVLEGRGRARGGKEGDDEVKK